MNVSKNISTFAWKLIFLAISMITFLFNSSEVMAQRKMIKDIDRNTYTSTKIGNQEWLTSNLKVQHFRNGDSIPYFGNHSAWTEACREKKPGWCYYNDDTLCGDTYGIIYNYWAIMDERGIAPKGWRIPIKEDLDELMDHFQLSEPSGIQMKSKHGWLKKIDGTSGNGSDLLGFNGKPGGYRNGFYFRFKNTHSAWWTSMPVPSRMYFFHLQYDGNFLRRSQQGNGAWYGMYVRCVKDSK